MVIGGSHLVAFAMGKLALDHVRPKAMLIKDGASGGAEAVAGGAAVIPLAVERIEHGIFAHVLRGFVLVRE